MFNAILWRSPYAKIATQIQTPKREQKTLNFIFARRASEVQVYFY
ncbi:hypothetical protein [Fischerella sp. PCC 9605]|nr:hypothetical protein [Fischerella sp. PCC 9605]